MDVDLDVMNRFAVSSIGDGIMIMVPPRGTLTKQSAVNLAAYLVAMADPRQEQFAPLLKAILET